MEVFTTIIKLISHLGILGALIFSFVFQTHLEGWFDWTIFITLCIIGICNIVFLIATNDDCDEKARPSVAGLMDFILLGSMVIRVLNNGCDPFLIPYIAIAFVAVSGVNRFTMNLLFIQANIYLISIGISSFSWHAITLIVISVILQIIMSINVFISRCDDEEEVPNLNAILGLIVISGTIAYLILLGNINIFSESGKILLIYYMIICLSSSIRDNAKFFALLPVCLTIFASLVIYEWHPLLSWIVLFIVCLTSVALYVCINELRYNLGVTERNLVKVKKSYKQLSEANASLRAENQRLRERPWWGGSGNSDSSPSNSDILKPLGDGVLVGVGREVGKKIAEIIIGIPLDF